MTKEQAIVNLKHLLDILFKSNTITPEGYQVIAASVKALEEELHDKKV